MAQTTHTILLLANAIHTAAMQALWLQRKGVRASAGARPREFPRRARMKSSGRGLEPKIEPKMRSSNANAGTTDAVHSRRPYTDSNNLLQSFIKEFFIADACDHATTNHGPPYTWVSPGATTFRIDYIIHTPGMLPHSNTLHEGATFLTNLHDHLPISATFDIPTTPATLLPTSSPGHASRPPPSTTPTS